VAQLQKIEKLIKKLLPREEVEGFEPEHQLPTKEVKSSGRRPPKKAKAKPGARKQREGQGKKRQGGPSAKRQGQAANRGGRNRKPARARA
jgi:ATP-dependent RNA helicase RhlE